MAKAKDAEDPTSQISLPWERGLAKIFTNPPKKIACGLNHSSSICNVHQDRGGFLANLPGNKAKTEIYCWGRNTSNVLGVGEHVGDVYGPQRLDKGVFQEMPSFPVYDAYEVACGANHTIVLMTFKEQKWKHSKGGSVTIAAQGDKYLIRDPHAHGDVEVDVSQFPDKGGICRYRKLTGEMKHLVDEETGMNVDEIEWDDKTVWVKDPGEQETGMVFGLGLAYHGRIGVEQPGSAEDKDDAWFPKEKACRIAFDGAYKVVDKASGAKSDGVYFHTHPKADAKEKGSILVWGCNVHGTPTRNGKWLRVDDKNGSRYLPMVQEPEGIPIILPIHVQILRIAAGSDHSLCLATTGVLYAFGLNSDGQCGVDREGDCLKPTPVATNAEVRHFACGARHSLMINAFGSLYSWGCSKQGRLGQGNTPNARAPEKNMYCSDTEFRFVACGEAHSGAIDEGDKVWSWGAGAHGRLGHGETVDCPTPQTIEVLEEMTVTQLALGGFHSVALTAKPQKVYTWGMGHATGQSPDGMSASFNLPSVLNLELDEKDDLSEIIQIATGSYHTLFLLRSGKIFSCGLGLGGRLGLGRPKDGPVKDHGLPTPHLRISGYALKIKGDASVMYFRRPSEKVLFVQVEAEKRADGMVQVAWDIEQIACGQMHSVVVTCGGGVFAWGDNLHGQLGIGAQSAEPVWSPKRIPFSGTKIIMVAVGGDHCLGVTEMGGVLAWGRGDSGQLGTGRQHDAHLPSKIDERFWPEGGQVIAIAASEEHSGAIVQGHEGNSLYMWGNSDNGKLGLGRNLPKTQPVPKEVESKWGTKIDGPTQVPLNLDMGPFHTAVIVGLPNSENYKAEVWAFGGGLYGRLGIEDTQKDHCEPAELKDLSEGEALSISCGTYHTAAIMSEMSAAGTPVNVPRGTTIGDLWVWGRSKMVCEIEHCLLPKKFNLIEGSSKFKLVRCGCTYTSVVMESGAVHSWGENTCGQLGHDTGGREQQRPEEIKNVPGAVMEMALGASHTLALLNNGELYGWGNQSCGRLGLEDKKIKSRHVTKPARVKAEWSSIEEITVAAAGDKKSAAEEEAVKDKGGEEAAEDDGSDRMLASLKSGQAVQYFATMQSLLKNEKPSCREPALRELEEDLTKELICYVEDIKTIPQKEKAVKQLETNLSQGLGPILKMLKNCKPPDTQSKVNPKVASKLKYYEELMWVLQQQPCYMAALSTCGLSGESAKTFNNVVNCIYAELEDSRTLHLFMAMLKLMIEKEVEQARDLSALFPADKSLVYSVFSNFALKPHHYKEVVWKFMDSAEPKNPMDAKSVLWQIADISKKGQFFALSSKEYAELTRKEGEDKDKQEQMADFMKMLQSFKEFMLGPFDKALMGATLHPNLRKMIYHTMGLIKHRNFDLGSKDQSIPKELLVCEPLLKLIVTGIIIPILQDPKKYSGPECFLSRASKGKDGNTDEENTFNNVAVIGKFLEEVLNTGYKGQDMSGPTAAGTRNLALIAKQVRQGLLKYVKEQGDYHDDTETHTTIDVYTAHYDRVPHSVAVASSDCMRMSNLLLANKSKVRQTDDDPAIKTCERITPSGQWDDDIIDEVSAEGNDRVHNFKINSRFIMDKRTDPKQPLIICRASDVPMPTYRESATYSFCATYSTSYVKQYMQDQPDSQCKVLEDLFREIDELEANKWTDLKAELDRQLKEATAKNPPNFIMAHKLQDGIRKVEELASVDSIPGDLLNEMSEKLMNRSNHRQYLEQVSKGLQTIKKAQMDHERELRNAEIAVGQMVDFSVTPSLPKKLVDAADDADTALQLELVRKKMVARKLNRRANLPTGTFAPTATFDLKKLQKDGTVQKMDLGTEQIQKTMTLTFMFATDGGVDIIINMAKQRKSFMLRQVKISGEQLQEFKRAQENDQGVGLPHDAPEPFMVVDAFKLSKLLTDVQTGR